MDTSGFWTPFCILTGAAVHLYRMGNMLMLWPTGTNCYNGTNDNAGCAVMGASSSYGAEANDDGGGAVSVSQISKFKLALTNNTC